MRKNAVIIRTKYYEGDILMLTLTVEEGSKCQEKHEASRNWKAQSNEYLPGDFSSNRSPKITYLCCLGLFQSSDLYNTCILFENHICDGLF